MNILSWICFFIAVGILGGMEDSDVTSWGWRGYVVAMCLVPFLVRMFQWWREALREKNKIYYEPSCVVDNWWRWGRHTSIRRR